MNDLVQVFISVVLILFVSYMIAGIWHSIQREKVYEAQEVWRQCKLLDYASNTTFFTDSWRRDYSRYWTPPED